MHLQRRGLGAQALEPREEGVHRGLRGARGARRAADLAGRSVFTLDLATSVRSFALAFDLDRSEEALENPDGFGGGARRGQRPPVFVVTSELNQILRTVIHDSLEPRTLQSAESLEVPN